MADIDDVLGESTPKKTKKVPAKTEAAPAKKTAKAAVEAAPAAKAAKPKAEATEADLFDEAPAKAARTPKEPVEFAEGEREALTKRIKQIVKKPYNSKELAVKLDIPTRKLRRLLYALKSQGVISLEAGESRVHGMTVSPVSPA